MRIRAERRSVDGSEDPRTYSIWVFVALFAVLALGGLFVLLFGGDPDEGTVKLHVPQTLPESDAAAGSSSTSTAPTTTAPTTTAPSSTTSTTTAPDRTGPTETLPDGVGEIIRDGDSTSMIFSAAQALQSGSGVPDGYTARVAPTSITPTEDGRGLQVRVGCAATADEVLAQVVVTETDTAITVASAVLVPNGGPPCIPGSSRVVPVALRAPVGGRTLAVVPSGGPLGATPGS